MELTDKVLLGALSGLLLYEGYTLVNKKKNDTESESIWRLLPRRPLIPFAIGFLLGHFVWQSQEIYDEVLVESLKRDGKVS